MHRWSRFYRKQSTTSFMYACIYICSNRSHTRSYNTSHRIRMVWPRTGRLRNLVASLRNFLSCLKRWIVVILEVFLEDFEMRRPKHESFSPWKTEITGRRRTWRQLGEVQRSGTKKLLGWWRTSVTGCSLHQQRGCVGCNRCIDTRTRQLLNSVRIVSQLVSTFISRLLKITSAAALKQTNSFLTVFWMLRMSETNLGLRQV